MLHNDIGHDMILGYKNEETKIIAESGALSKKVLRKLPKQLHKKARIKIAILDAIVNLETLANYPGLDFKKIGNFYQIRINNTYRVRFAWDGKNIDNVDIGDFHQ